MNNKVEEQFSEAVHAAVEAAKSEHGTLGSRNSIRWAKGVAANQAIELAKGLPKGTFTGSPQKFVREKIMNVLTNTGAGVNDSVVSATELSITAGAAKAWLDLRGLETPYGKDGALVADIAIDKVYALKSIKEYEDASDTLLTFADTYDELTCKNLRKLTNTASIKGAKVVELVDDIERQSSESGVSVSDIIKGRLDDLSDEPDMSNIRVETALYEGDWNDIRSHMGVIDQFMGFATEEKTGWTTNTRTLERLMSWFVPREYGFESIIRLFVENGEMTEAEAETFKRGLETGVDDEEFTDNDADLVGEDGHQVEAGEIQDEEVLESEVNRDSRDDELVEQLKIDTADLEIPDSRLQEEIEAERYVDENTPNDDFDFDDDPVYDDGPLPWD